MRGLNDKPFLQWFKDYLTFHSQEKTRVISLSVFILGLLVVQLYLSFRQPTKNLESIEFLGAEHFTKLETQIAIAESEKEWKKPSKAKNESTRKPLVAFNPNELDSAGWRSIGLSPKQAQVMVRIRNERNGFKSKAELERINMLDHVINDIRLLILLPDSAPKKVYEKRKFNDQTFKKDTGKHKWTKKEFKKLNIDLNTTDTLELVELYGIGPSFARRIIKFRNALGGFHSKEQLLDVWGMDSARYTGIEDEVFIHSQKIETIDINSASYEQLKSHPYIKYKVARAIVNYRKQHGDFKSVDELSKIHLIDQALLQKIQPYLKTMTSKN